MIALEELSSLREYLQTAQSVAVIVGAKPSNDQLAVASSLYQSLKEQGKEVGFYSPKKINDSKLTVANQISSELGKQNLVVEFDYDEAAVDKVSYHIGQESNKFYLTIKPKKGHKPLSTSSVQFSYAGTDSDLVFLIGVHDLETLDQLYFGYENLYENAFVVTLNTFKPELGNVQLDLSGMTCMSEAMADVLESLNLPLTADAATDLLRSLEESTDGLRSLTVDADTFETVAKLLRAGARRESFKFPKQEKMEESGRKLAEVERPVEQTIKQQTNKNRQSHKNNRHNNRSKRNK